MGRRGRGGEGEGWVGEIKRDLFDGWVGKSLN